MENVPLHLTIMLRLYVIFLTAPPLHLPPPNKRAYTCTAHIPKPCPTPSPSQIFAAGHGGCVRVWDLRQASRPLDELSGHQGLVTAMELIPSSGGRGGGGGGPRHRHGAQPFIR